MITLIISNRYTTQDANPFDHHLYPVPTFANEGHVGGRCLPDDPPPTPAPASTRI
jgi:hypothetical protein